MRPAATLLAAEAEALRPVLDRTPIAHFDRDTVLDRWRVRDVLAHCGAALDHLIAGDELVFTPEANQVDVDQRAGWTVDAVVDELFARYGPAARVIDRADGLVDGLGLGEWVHGGDVRDALDEPDAYRSAGVELALPLLIERSQQRDAVGVTAVVDGAELVFGTGRPTGRLVTDTATFVRLCAGRAPDPTRFELTGAAPASLVLFS